MTPNEFSELWKKAQQAWLEGCINAYGKFLNSAEEFLKMNKQYHEKAKEAVKENRGKEGENK